jgi:hypothetical protein
MAIRRSLSGTHDDETLVFDPFYKHINGGPGIDTLFVPPSSTLDLRSHDLFGIEVFDLSGGSSTIILDARQVMRLTSAPHTLQISGSAGDAVVAMDGWSYAGVSGSDTIYTNKAATLIIDADVRRSGIVDHAPDAQEDKSLTVAENAGATPLDIAMPTELDGDPLAVCVVAVPHAAIGSVYVGALDGGTAVVEGQTLTVQQTGRLVFVPVHNADGSAGVFSYTLSDQGTSLGLSDQQTITIEVTPSQAGPRVIDFVPAYNWYHGCGPTAAASVFGYWDVLGYGDYFDASGWDQLRYTFYVKDEISSPAHNAKFDPTPDNPSLPVPPQTSIADFFHTSQDPLGYGWTYLSYVETGMEAYASLRGRPLDAWTVTAGSTTWQTLVNEIDAGHPSVFLVDTNGDSVTDHFVPVLGYDDRGDEGLWYGAYTTWSENETVNWFPFQTMGSGRSWGVGYATFVDKPSDIAQRTDAITYTGAEAGGTTDLDFDLVVRLVGSDGLFAAAPEHCAA